jgi:hypothetical protein
MKLQPVRPSRPTSLLTQLIEAPDLVQQVRELPTESFAALVRAVGVEDAGEIVALATTEQLVAAFDEDLFVNDRPGEREAFDPERFAVWLEVLLEAGDAVAAGRVAELSEDFVTQALASQVLVLDNEALMLRMDGGGADARMADKALQSALCEEIDGYLLISRRHEGWDAVLTLILALDRDHRALLERVLDRCSDAASELVEDLEALTTVLTQEASLAEDVEAEREDRRSREGHVEPRQARAFLALARTPDAASDPAARDPLTRAYFRQLERHVAPAPGRAGPTPRPVRELLGHVAADAPGLAPLPTPRSTGIQEALRRLGETDPAVLRERVEELAYLANVLVAGAEIDGRRFRPAEAAEAVLATVELGAEREALAARSGSRRAAGSATRDELAAVLRGTGADRLFRRASAELAAHATASPGFLRSPQELAAHLARTRDAARTAEHPPRRKR